MGVYVVGIREKDKGGVRWIKVGHAKITERRPLLSDRLDRGFGSCIRPQGMCSHPPIKVIQWFPGLTTKHEKALHRKLKGCGVGEFYDKSFLKDILSYLRNIEKAL